MSSTGEQNIFIRFITPWLGPFSNQGVGQSWLFPAEKSYLIKKIILWWYFNITLALQFTDKEGSLFLKWEWERPCAKIQSPPKRTPSAGSCCWDLELEQGELVIKVMIRPREIHLYLSFLFSQLRLFLQELSVLWTLPHMVQQVRQILCPDLVLKGWFCPFRSMELPREFPSGFPSTSPVLHPGC